MPVSRTSCTPPTSTHHLPTPPLLPTTILPSCESSSTLLGRPSSFSAAFSALVTLTRRKHSNSSRTRSYGARSIASIGSTRPLTPQSSRTRADSIRAGPVVVIRCAPRSEAAFYLTVCRVACRSTSTAWPRSHPSSQSSTRSHPHAATNACEPPPPTRLHRSLAQCRPLRDHDSLRPPALHPPPARDRADTHILRHHHH